MISTLSIIIPVHNEVKTIEKVLASIEEVDIGNIQKKVIIVDDFSTDGTRDLLATLPSKYQIILKEKNEGKGSAVKTGILASTGDLVIIQDADLEYSPAISLSNMMSRVSARFDTVTVLGGVGGSIRIPCRIETIRPLDVKALKQAQKDLREAKLVEREAAAG